MAIQECSLYNFRMKDGTTKATTPKDLTARKMGARVATTVNHGATRTVTIDLSVGRLLVLGHSMTAGIRGVYIISTDGTVSAVVPAEDMTVSCTVSSSVGTLAVTSSTTSSSNARMLVI